MLSNTPILRVDCELENILQFGPTPYGERRVINILGGTVTGPRLKARILPGGADWQIIRTDGVTDVQARYTLQTETGGLILVDSQGLRHGPPEVLAAIFRGEEVDPSLYYFRTVMRFETGDKAAAWLNKIVALATGKREKNRVKLDVYEVV